MMSPPPTPSPSHYNEEEGGGRGGGAETMYNKITSMFSKEYCGSIVPMHVAKFRKSGK